MHTGFVHSVKVPRLYKSAAKITREVSLNGGSLKNLIYEQKHPNVSALYSLCVTVMHKKAQLGTLINKTQILLNEPRLDQWLARILITELLWGKKTLNSDCKPAQTILSYEKQLREELEKLGDIKTAEPCKTAAQRPRYVRINTLQVSLDEAILSHFKDEGWILLPKCENYSAYLDALKNLSGSYFIQDFHIPELCVFPSGTTFHDHPGYHSGALVLQDKASCLPVKFLNPEPGSTVLDVCAAPGMKTTHLAALMKNEGKIYAVEINKTRYNTLREQVNLTNSFCVETINKDVLTLNPNDYSDVNYILVDPSCSGSGMLSRTLVSAEQEECSPQRLKQLQAFQVFLLRYALLNYPNAKRVVYSTCSIHPQENEEVINEILNDVQDAYKLVPAKDLLENNWLNYSSTNYKCSDKCLYAKSDVDLCNGFFVAVFDRDFDVPLPQYKRKGSNQMKQKEEPKEEPEENDKPVTEVTKAVRIRKKRGKKKKGDSVPVSSTLNDATQTNDSVEVQNEGNPPSDEEPPVKKKKKKEENPPSDEEPPVKKKKKKKKEEKEENLPSNEEPPVKKKKEKKEKKKKKKSHTKEEDPESS